MLLARRTESQVSRPFEEALAFPQTALLISRQIDVKLLLAGFYFVGQIGCLFITVFLWHFDEFLLRLNFRRLSYNLGRRPRHSSSLGIHISRRFRALNR